MQAPRGSLRTAFKLHALLSLVTFRAAIVGAALVAAPPAATVLRAAQASILPPGHPDAADVVVLEPTDASR